MTLNSFVIPPNSNTFPDWRRTCHVPLVKTQWRPRANKTQWRPRKHYLELWTCTWSGRASWNRGKFVCQPRQANNFYAVMAAKRFQTLYFELGGITKHLMTGPSGNSEFCFPSSLNVPLGFASGNIKVSGKQNSLFPLGPVIKCLIFAAENYTNRI